MVNFRFHIVSLIAVFLALGLGILMGSAVVNGAIVDRLDREIDQVRKESDNLREANRQANSELDRANEFLNDSAAYAVAGRLTDVPVVVMAERGVSGDVVDDTAQLVIAAGAQVPAVFWLEERWKLETEEDVQALRDAADLLGSASSVRTRALGELAARLTEPVDTRVESESEPTDLVARLEEAGFLGIDGDNVDLTTFPPRPARALVITGTNSQLAGTDMTVETVSAFADAEAPTVAGEVFVASDAADAPERGAAVAPVRTNDGLSALVTTVDDLDLVAGRVATVIALQDLERGVVGHYGYGDGATSSLPPPPGEQ